MNRLTSLLLVVFAISVSSAADGGNYDVLLSFTGSGGNQPYGSLTLSGSNLFGMTRYGGVNICGTIFSINTDGSGDRSLLSFSGTSGAYIGATPLSGSLTLSGSTFYGMTWQGGANGDGNIFSVNTDGSGFQNLLSFTGTGGAYPGMYPHGSLTLSGSTLYGMTCQGGANSDGNIFSVRRTAAASKTCSLLAAPTEQVPIGNVTLSGSTLYGMTGLWRQSTAMATFSASRRTAAASKTCSPLPVLTASIPTAV